MKRIGCINYATEQGLGRLAKSFYDAGVITHYLIIRHSVRPSVPEWFPGAAVIKPRDIQAMRDFCDNLDVLLIIETPFDWTLIPYCKARGIKTVLIPMYECMPARLPEQPDLIIAPSALDQHFYPGSEFIPIPVENVKWRRRETARVFVHNAGHLGLRGRNGTAELIEAVPLCKQPVRVVIRCQEDIRPRYSKLDPRIDLQIGTVPFDGLWKIGDVFIFPEKFNGLSLPLQEARAAGMLVMCGDRFPMNTWLPKAPLIPVRGYNRVAIGGCNPFDEAQFNPADIAETMDAWYGQDISGHSEAGWEWSRTMTWEALKPRYLTAMGVL